MTDLAAFQARYLRDPLPIRLGGLAANLARIQAWSDHPGHRDVVNRLLEESKFFIEWTAADVALDLQVALVSLQRQLTHWQRRWEALWDDPSQRMMLAEQAQAWAQRILAMSGLLPKTFV